MSDFSIGLSGLEASQKAIDIIGNNIANLATEGYHRQKIDFSPGYSLQEGSLSLGGGVDVKGITRVIDTLLEQEILRQQSALGQVSQESVTLRTIENVLGELSTEDSGLNAAIDKFFNSLQDLSAHPTESIWQNQIVSDAKAMAGQFRTLGEFLNSLETQITLETKNIVGTINTLTSQIAEFNGKIGAIEISGGSASGMSDQRDQCISELSELIGIRILNKKYGVVDVIAGEIPLVMNATAQELEVGLDENGDLGITVTNAFNYTTNIQSGKIGGLLSLKNEIVSDIHDDLDSLADTIIQQINQYHVQGVGSEGSFTSLTGQVNASGDLADFSTVAAGYTYIRVTKISDGTVVRTAIPVLQNEDSDTLTEVAGFINGAGVANVTASVNSSNQLTITAAAGYEFDFLPGVLSEPTSSNLNGDTGTSIPTVTISGIYTGTEEQTFTCTVLDDGQIGNGTLRVKVEIGADFVAEVNLGEGYAAGDLVDIGYGIKMRFDLDLTTGKGILNKDEIFTIEALANSDTSGVLAAVGINTFFSGSGAQNMAVRSDISANPKQVATALGAEMTDNTNAVRMADVKDEAFSDLSGLTCGEFYRQMVTDIGQQLSVKQMRQDNIEVMVLNLENQQGEISGVDINNEAAQLLVFEQMFQAMAQYMNTISSSMANLMELL